MSGANGAELDEADVDRDAGQLVGARRRADDDRPAAALGDGLGAAGRQHAVADGDHGEHAVRVGASQADE